MLHPRAEFQAPHIPPWEERPPVLRWLRSVRTNMLNLVGADAYHEPIVADRLGPVRWHVASSPAALRHIFRDRLECYPKAPIMARMLGPYLGSGLLLARDSDWHWQRRALSPSFVGTAINAMAPAMRIVAQGTVARLLSKGGSRDPVAMSFEMRVAAMEMVRQTMFADLGDAATNAHRVGKTTPDPDNLGDYRSTIQADLDRFLQNFGRPGLSDLLGLPVWARPGRWVSKTPTAGPRRLIRELVQARRRSGTNRGDLLDILLDARDPESGRVMTDDEISDNLLTFIITGSDTTALSLTWAIYILTRRPDWAALLRKEADAILDTVPDEDLVERLPLTRAFLSETMRLFPPVPLVVRRASRPDRIGEHAIRRGETVFAPIYVLHRRPDIWPDPHRFKPARFLHGRRPGPFTYLPFGAGPRSCIGSRFAIAEATICLSEFVRSLDFQLASGWNVKPLMMLTLKPDGGLPIHVRGRFDPECDHVLPTDRARGHSSAEWASTKASI